MVSRYLLPVVLVVSLCAPLWAVGPVASSWEGLSGLYMYTLPTAETLAHGQIALDYAEARYGHENMRTKLTDTWFVYSATFVPIERLELAVSGRHEIVHEAPLSSAAFTTRSDLDRALGHLKYTIMPPRPGHLALAIGAQDITGATNELGDGRDDRGRRLFLVGTYDWATLGITHMHGKIGEYAGVRLTATNGID